MDATRKEQIKKLFTRAGLNAIVCRNPQHVVMFTGYQPMLGESFCLVSLNAEREVEIRLVIPDGEEELVPRGVAIETKNFSVETMTSIGNAVDAAREPLSQLLRSANLREGATIGYEGGRSPIVTAYTQVGYPGYESHEMLRLLVLGGELRDASDVLEELASIKTNEEIQAIRRSEELAVQGFNAARNAIRAGAREGDIAAAATAAMSSAGYALPYVRNVQPYVHVMAGTRSALAYKAFNMSSNYALQEGDPVLVQIEIGINGYWAELTRTFFVNTMSDEWHTVLQTCVEAQHAALALIRAGAQAKDVDSVARNVLQQAGFGKAFKHGLGHGLGFQAINHADAPVLHPASKAVLQSGMIHNLEPAVYLDGKGGFRLNDNVLVLENGSTLLSSSLPQDAEWLTVKN